jgi:hypothetical protein
MKRNPTLLLFFLFVTVLGWAQSPHAFKYQALLRDQNGALLINKNVVIRISILQTSIEGSSVFSETHRGTSSSSGTISLEIGNGTPVSGSFDLIRWGNDSFFVKVEMDPNGGSAFELLGVAQLLSVPYALYAEKSGDEKWDSVATGIAYNKGKVSIGTTTQASPSSLYINTSIPTSDTDKSNGLFLNATEVVSRGFPLWIRSNTGSLNYGTSVGNTMGRQLRLQDMRFGSEGIWDFGIDQNNSLFILGGSSTDFTKKFTLTKDGKIGIGTSAPTTKLDINGGSDLNVLSLKNENNSLGMIASVSSETDFHGSALIGKRSRGGLSSPSLVQNGDRITGLYGSLFANNDYQNAGAIHMYVGPNPGTNSFPVNIRFETTNTNETTRMERMRITESGNVGIGTSSPNYKLDVAGTINAAGLLINGQPINGSDIWSQSNSDIYYSQGKVSIGATSQLSRSSLFIDTPIPTSDNDKSNGLFLNATEVVSRGFPLWIRSNTGSLNYGTSVGNTLGRQLRFQDMRFGSEGIWDFGIDQNNSLFILGGSSTDFTKKFTLTKDGKIGIGTSSPVTKLDIDGGNDLNLLYLKNENNSLGMIASVSSNTDFHGSALIGKRSRGSVSSPSLVQNGDRITGLYGSLFANNDYQNAGAIHMYVGPNPGTNSFPVNIRFETTNTNETTRTERMRITENGLVKVSTNDVYLEQVGTGVIMKSPNGQCWRMTINDSGSPLFTAIPCP